MTNVSCAHRLRLLVAPLLLGLAIAMPLYASDRDAVLQVLDDYMDAVNRIDLDGVVATYHFPHFRVARGEIVVWNTPQEAMPMLALPKEQRLAEMRKALGPHWQRTDWSERNILDLGDTKAHVDTEFIRYNTDGEEMERVSSLYILTREKGVWRIKGRSSFSAQ